MLRNRRGYLEINRFDERVLEIMERTDRAEFAPPEEKNIFEDSPFKIGHGQTCSQPSMVAAMASILNLEPGMKVLEIGTGCGYSTAVAAPLLEPGGKLFTVEIVPELSQRARETLDRLGRSGNVEFVIGDGSVGLPAQAPFDRIYLTAGVGRSFDYKLLLGQIKPEGILLYPEAHGSMFIVKKTQTGHHRQSIGGVGFVFLKGENSGFD